MPSAITIQIDDLNQLESFCVFFLSLLTPADVVALDGELGAGKTTTVQSLCRLSGVSEAVNSPTFSITHQYTGKTLNIIHVDAYRIDNEADPKLITLDEAIVTGKSLILVEWANKLSSFEACWTWQLELKRGVDDDKREIIVKNWPKRLGDQSKLEELFSACIC